MSYATVNFKTKKALKDAVLSGRQIGVFENGPFPAPADGTVYLEGPHYPAPHTWYAQVKVVDGIIVKVVK